MDAAEHLFGVDPASLREIFRGTAETPERIPLFPLVGGHPLGGQIVMRIASKTENEAKAILATWKANEVIDETKYKVPKGDERTCIALNEVKVAAMLASFAADWSAPMD